jgi:16S rRNA G966 N2-methylase RsmD
VLERPPDRRFDYVYIAPPQYKELWKRALLNLDDHSGWLGEDAWVIVQIHPQEYEPLSLDNLAEFEQRKYGSTLLVFYERRSIEQRSNERRSIEVAL